jgi:hypothetical protein
MEAILEAMQKALADDATPEQRAAAAQVCRALLAKLEPAPTETATPGDAVGQIIDTVIAKLNAARSARVERPQAAPRLLPRRPEKPIPYVPARRRKP